VSDVEFVEEVDENREEPIPQQVEESIEEEDQLEDAGEQSAQETAEEKDELETLRAELEQARAQAAEYLDGWQRARAEFANYKKRMDAEREQLRRTSNETLLLKLLPVVDDFERAFESLPDDETEASWAEGFTIILRKLQTVLESERVTPIEAEGQPFDPQWHEAVMQEETTDHPDGYVIEEMQRGYRLGERVLRPSRVKVARNGEDGEDRE
jgi:molecular chaperone GrpE